MTSQELRDQILRSEGYAEGFRVGYAACAKWIAEQAAKEEKEKDKKE